MKNEISLWLNENVPVLAVAKVKKVFDANGIKVKELGFGNFLITTQEDTKCCKILLKPVDQNENNKDGYLYCNISFFNEISDERMNRMIEKSQPFILLRDWIEIIGIK